MARIIDKSIRLSNGRSFKYSVSSEKNYFIKDLDLEELGNFKKFADEDDKIIYNLLRNKEEMTSTISIKVNLLQQLRKLGFLNMTIQALVRDNSTENIDRVCSDCIEEMKGFGYNIYNHEGVWTWDLNRSKEK